VIILEEIIAVDRNSVGEIISFKTTSDRVISYQKAIQEIKSGVITGVEIVENYEGDDPIIVQNNNPTDFHFENFPPIY
jgi:hypothetical protein